MKIRELEFVMLELWPAVPEVLDCTFCYVCNVFPEEEDSDVGEDEDEDEDADVGKLSQEEYLKKLKQCDPEFYATMMQSSEVLDMHSSDSEEELEGDEEEDDPEREGGELEPPYATKVTVI